MEFLHATKLLTVLLFVHGAYGQTVTLTGPDPSTVQQGNNTIFTCSVNGGTTVLLEWVDDSALPRPETIYSRGERFSVQPKYTNFQLTSETPTTSEMTIESTAVEDEGIYFCRIPEDNSDTIDLIVEVRSSHSLTLSSTDTNKEDMYVATCEATGGKPVETISWILNGTEQSDGNDNTIENTNPAATAPLSNTKSVFTFPANIGNYEQTLVCDITGHTLTELNGQESKDLNIHTSPSTANTVVTVGWVTQGTDITVSCTAENQPSPTMRNYYIYSNETEIHESMEGVNTVTVSNPEEGTQYTCKAGNYLGDTLISAPDTYDPTRTTIPPPTTEPTPGSSTPDPTGGQGLGAGAIAGIAVGAIVVIIIIIVLIIKFVLKPECLSLGSSSGGGGASSKKHGSSSVGSSNGNEKNDVEAPLNGVNEVVTKDKMKPTPTPRVQSSVPHTNDNPGHEQYAMVDRKPKPGGGGDMPDTRGNGAGQNEPAGMHYADLDLTAKAGHHEREVPQNPDNVVVYSSILV